MSLIILIKASPTHCFVYVSGQISRSHPVDESKFIHTLLVQYIYDLQLALVNMCWRIDIRGAYALPPPRGGKIKSPNFRDFRFYTSPLLRPPNAPPPFALSYIYATVGMCFEDMWIKLKKNLSFLTIKNAI